MRHGVIVPMGPLLIFSAMLSVLITIYVASGTMESQAFERLSSFSWVILLVLWITGDARRSRRTPCYDLGFFCALFFPVSLVWYCIWSRGWRGLLMLMALTAIFLTPYLLGQIVWLLKYA